MTVEQKSDPIYQISSHIRISPSEKNMFTCSYNWSVSVLNSYYRLRQCLPSTNVSLISKGDTELYTEPILIVMCG